MPTAKTDETVWVAPRTSLVSMLAGSCEVMAMSTSCCHLSSGSRQNLGKALFRSTTRDVREVTEAWRKNQTDSSDIVGLERGITSPRSFCSLFISNIHITPVQIVPSFVLYPRYAVILWKDLYPRSGAW